LNIQFYETLATFAQVRWDFTISLSNVITFVVSGTAAVIAWRDLTWRIRNLEEWRKEHMVDAAARDALITGIKEMIAGIKEILGRLEWVEEHRKELAPWNGKDRRQA